MYIKRIYRFHPGHSYSNRQNYVLIIGENLQRIQTFWNNILMVTFLRSRKVNSLMCFADHLNFLLLIFCFLGFVLSQFFHFVPTLYYCLKECIWFKNLLFLKSDSNPKHFSLFVFDFNVSNKISSTPTRLLYFQDFFNPLVYSNPSSPVYWVLKNFSCCCWHKHEKNNSNRRVCIFILIGFWYC